MAFVHTGGEKHTGGGRESGSDSWKQYMRRSTWYVHMYIISLWVLNKIIIKNNLSFDLWERYSGRQ